MARIALSFLKRFVLHIAASCQICSLMALIAKLASLLSGPEGFLRSGGIVAFVAVNLENNGMHARFQKLGLD